MSPRLNISLDLDEASGRLDPVIKEPVALAIRQKSGTAQH